MNLLRAAAIWLGLGGIVITVVVAAISSPLLEWRSPVYIVAGLAGVIGLVVLLFQPLLTTGYLPGINTVSGRRIHHWLGGMLLLSVLTHVAGLWITSPPDVLDALLFRSPTAFSLWGVIGMWCVLATALLAAFRQKLKLKLRIWRRAHKSLAVIIVIGTVVHALQIEGTMETLSKTVLCVAVVISTVLALAKR